MGILFEVIISYTSVIAGLISILTTLISVFYVKRGEKRIIQKTEEKKFENVLASDDIVVLGSYLNNVLGPINIYEYTASPKIAERLDKYLERIQAYIGTGDEVSKGIERPQTIEPDIFSRQLSDEFGKILKEVRTGEAWNALARLRRYIEITLKETVKILGIPQEGVASAGRLLSLLERSEFINKNISGKLRYSISICNKAVHGLDISPQEAEEAIYLARAAVDELIPIINDKVGFKISEQRTESDIKKTVSEILNATNITPDAIDTRIHEKIEEKISEQDKRIAEIVAQKLDEIDKRLKKSVGNSSDYLRLGNVRFDQGDYLKAIEYYEKALELEPHYVDAWVNIGGALGNLGQHDEAIKAYNKAIEIKPNIAEAWFNKGNSLCDLEQYDKAIEAYNKAIDIKPDFAYAWHNKGSALEKDGQYEKALDAYNKAININPNFAEPWINKGVILSKLNRHKEALDVFNKAIEIEPEYAEAWFNKGNTLSKLHRYQEALDAFDKVIRIKPNYAEAWYNKGHVLSKDLSRHEEALNAYNKAVEIKPDYAEAWGNIGVALVILDKYEEALKVFDKVKKIIPEDARTWFNCARIYSLKREKGKALSELKKAIEINKSIKELAKNNEDLKFLWDSEDFKKLVE